MTDKQIIETLKNIKNKCNTCTSCKFKLKEIDLQNGYSCQIRQLAYQLNKHSPQFWDIEKIERIIKQ